MSDHTPSDDDPTADTARFQAFVRRGETDSGGNASATVFRVATLVGGLVVLGLLVWLLFAG